MIRDKHGRIQPHYWAHDPSNPNHCGICGDSPWGVHRFQTQPGDSDFIDQPLARYCEAEWPGGYGVVCELMKGHTQNHVGSGHLVRAQWPVEVAEPRCDGRYPVGHARDEPFDVTYRCGDVKGHDGPHGPAASDGSPR